MNTQSIPRIVRETSGGLAAYALTDEMLSRRELECAGEICPELTDTLCRALRYLDRQDPTAPITLYIHSPGGQVDAGLALLDTMRAVSAPIVTVCQGTAASMAAVIFACGDQRWILPHGKVLIHDPRIPEPSGGSALELRETAGALMRARQVLGALLAEACGKTPQQILRKTRRDCVLTGEEAIAFGLADALLTDMTRLGEGAAKRRSENKGMTPTKQKGL